MKNIILKILVCILKTIYMPMKLLKIKNKVTYISRQTNNENLDFKLIKEQMEQKYPEYKNIILNKKIDDGLINKFIYCLHILKQMYHLATSKIVIVDTYCIVVCVLSHKKETKVIQIWHALGAIKKFGYQTINKKSGAEEKTAKIMGMHKNYDYVLASSKKTAEIYKDAFKVKEEQIIYIGMPRIDKIMKQDEEVKEKIYNKYPILKGKINILYAPTFRKNKKVELDELVEKIDTEKYNLIVKLHPLDLEKYTYIKKDGIIYDKDFNTYELIKIANKVITDYSSLAIDASILNIPIYFYTYDIDKYKDDPGLNLNFENDEIGKYMAKSTNELLNLIDQDYEFERLKKYKMKYVDTEINNCTERLVDFLTKKRMVYGKNSL